MENLSRVAFMLWWLKHISRWQGVGELLLISQLAICSVNPSTHTPPHSPQRWISLAFIFIGRKVVVLCWIRDFWQFHLRCFPRMKKKKWGIKLFPFKSIKNFHFECFKAKKREWNWERWRKSEIVKILFESRFLLSWLLSLFPHHRILRAGASINVVKNGGWILIFHFEIFLF